MKKTSRREFLNVVGASAVAIPLAALMKDQVAWAGDLPQLDVKDAQAQALGYVHKSEQSEQLCINCQLYQGEADKEWGPCAIFPGKAVNANGWCRSWVVKAS